MAIFSRYKTYKELVRSNISIKKIVKGNWITYLIFQKEPPSDFYKGANPKTREELKKYVLDLKNERKGGILSNPRLKEYIKNLPKNQRGVYIGWGRAWVGYVNNLTDLYEGKELIRAFNQIGINNRERVAGLTMLYPEGIKEGVGVGGFVFDFMLKDITKYRTKYVFAFAVHGPIIPLLKKWGFKPMMITTEPIWSGVIHKQLKVPLDHWIKKLR